jgi:short subunit dehydrogenase-like uncharacterized protein
MANWMIYGANGYTGRLIAEEARRRGMTPVLAGRSEAVVRLARELGFEARRFGLSSVEEAASGLREISAVLHCAGPFSATSRPMLEACLRTGTHYLDITGEVAVFESVFERDRELKSAGVTAIPGVGFDVVPTDTVARLLKDRLPDATRLKLAWKAEGSFSPGTFRTMMEGLSQGAIVRKDGNLVRVPMGSKSIRAPFGGAPENAILIAWGDVATAFHTTGIPDIEVYIAGSRAAALGMRGLGLLARSEAIVRMAKRAAPRIAPGPSERVRERARVFIWGEARNAAGKAVTQRLSTPEGYRFTALSSLAAVDRLLSSPPPAGALTPVMAFGPDFIRSIPGVEIL